MRKLLFVLALLPALAAAHDRHKPVPAPTPPPVVKPVPTPHPATPKTVAAPEGCSCWWQPVLKGGALVGGFSLGAFYLGDKKDEKKVEVRTDTHTTMLTFSMPF